MAVKLNSKGNKHARSLINSGKVDTSSKWSFSADDGNAILGDDDWSEYSKWFMGIDDSEDKETKGYYKYPFGKGGKVYRSGLIAIRQRAAQQDETEIYNAAGKLIELIDKKDKKSSRCFERTETDPFEIELREDGEGPVLSGLAIPYKRWSEKLGWFTERIHPGASTKTLRESPDIACIYNHNNDFILGRTSAGTLELDERSGGVYYNCPLGGQTYAQDLIETIKRKDIQGNSFAFAVPEGKEKWTEQGETITRDVYEIQLFEVGPQVFPAYSQTNVKVRSKVDQIFDQRLLSKANFFALKGLTLPSDDVDNLVEQFRCLIDVLPRNNSTDIRAITDFVQRVGSRYADVTDNERQAFENHISVVRSFIPEPGNHSDHEGEPSEGHSLQWLKDQARMMDTIMQFTI